MSVIFFRGAHTRNLHLSLQNYITRAAATGSKQKVVAFSMRVVLILAGTARPRDGVRHLQSHTFWDLHKNKLYKVVFGVMPVCA